MIVKIVFPLNGVTVTPTTNNGVKTGYEIIPDGAGGVDFC